MQQQNTYIMYLDSEFLAIGLRSYANYSIDLQAIIDFPIQSYSFGNPIHSEVIRTMANCMQSDIYTDPTATISHKSPKPRKNWNFLFFLKSVQGLNFLQKP